MLTGVTVICVDCKAANQVTPRETVSYKGGRVIALDEPKCNVCRHWLHPSPDEWVALLQAMIADGQDVPPRWWEIYAYRNAPTSLTA